MAQGETEKLKLLFLEYQAAWENYRHLFSMRFDLLKYLFGVVFAVAGVVPVVLSYVQARGITIRTNYPMLLLLVVVSGVLALLALLTYGLLVNWNQALRKYHRTVTNIRQYVYGSDSPEAGLVTIVLPADPVEDRLLHSLHSSAPTMECVAVLFLIILLLFNWAAALWLSAHAPVAPAYRLAPLVLPLFLTVLSGFALGRRALLAARFHQAQKPEEAAAVKEDTILRYTTIFQTPSIYVVFAILLIIALYSAIKVITISPIISLPIGISSSATITPNVISTGTSSVRSNGTSSVRSSGKSSARSSGTSSAL